MRPGQPRLVRAVKRVGLVVSGHFPVVLERDAAEQKEVSCVTGAP